MISFSLDLDLRYKLRQQHFLLRLYGFLLLSDRFQTGQGGPDLLQRNAQNFPGGQFILRFGKLGLGLLPCLDGAGGLLLGLVLRRQSLLAFGLGGGQFGRGLGERGMGFGRILQSLDLEPLFRVPIMGVCIPILYGGFDFFLYLHEIYSGGGQSGEDGNNEGDANQHGLRLLIRLSYCQNLTTAAKRVNAPLAKSFGCILHRCRLESPWHDCRA